MLKIKVLGVGCANCKKVEEITRQALTYMSLQAEIIKVTDHAEIMNYPILSTPVLVTTKKLLCSGRIPSQTELTTWLADAELEAG